MQKKNYFLGDGQDINPYLFLLGPVLLIPDQFHCSSQEELGGVWGQWSLAVTTDTQSGCQRHYLVISGLHPALVVLRNV